MSKSDLTDRNVSFILFMFYCSQLVSTLRSSSGESTTLEDQ